MSETEERLTRLERIVELQQRELSMVRQVLSSHQAAICTMAQHLGATIEQQPAQIAPLTSFN